MNRRFVDMSPFRRFHFVDALSISFALESNMHTKANYARLEFLHDCSYAFDISSVKLQTCRLDYDIYLIKQIQQQSCIWKRIWNLKSTKYFTYIVNMLFVRNHNGKRYQLLPGNVAKSLFWRIIFSTPKSSDCRFSFRYPITSCVCTLIQSRNPIDKFVLLQMKCRKHTN